MDNCPFCNRPLIFLKAIYKYGCAFCDYVVDGDECKQTLLNNFRINF